jgi:NAD(P) transhydrogenase
MAILAICWLLNNNAKVKIVEKLVADYVIIGSGPAGQKAAIQAAKLGKTVIVIERDAVPGGASLNSGTIPSKSLREAILDLTGFYQRSYYGQEKSLREISINDLNYSLHRILKEQRAALLKQFEKNKIQLIYGTAQFQDENHVRVLDVKGTMRCFIQGQFFLIATGSKPRHPINVPFDHHTVLDSSRLLDIDRVPKTLIVLGGGIIGSEYASFFSALGTQVYLADRRERMLAFLDAEIGMHLQRALTHIGLQFFGNRIPESISRTENGASVRFRDGSSLQADMLLYALGGEANVEDLHIEAAGISVNEKGYIPVNALFQSVKPNIYAAGDVIGPPALASTSMEQGRLAARHAFGERVHHFPLIFPIGIYTIPEISSCGYTEDQLKQLGFRYEVGRAYYYEIARNQISGRDTGLFKLLFHAETLEILGIHIIGRNATEVIHIGQIAMSFNARIDYFVDQVFNYPTYAEGYRIAALNGWNKIQHNT